MIILKRDLIKTFERTNIDWTVIEEAALDVGKSVLCGQRAETFYLH